MGFTTLDPQDVAPGKVGKSEHALIFYDNPIAIARREAGAPIVSIGTPIYITSGSGVWVVPDGVVAIKVTAVGGGAGGGGARQSTESGFGGGAGGLSSLTITVTPGQTFSYTVGTGGAGGTAPNVPNSGAGDDGTPTTFGPMSAFGGNGGGGIYTGSPQISNSSGVGGNSSGGTINSRGNHAYFTGNGGSSSFGSGGVQDVTQTSLGQSASGYGSGGAGGYSSVGVADGGAGSGGLIIIEY